MSNKSLPIRVAKQDIQAGIDYDDDADTFGSAVPCACGEYLYPGDEYCPQCGVSMSSLVDPKENISNYPDIS